MVNEAPEENIDRLKFLYEFTREEFDREDARWEDADKKAVNFTPVLALLLGIAGFFGKWLLDEKMCHHIRR